MIRLSDLNFDGPFYIYDLDCVQEAIAALRGSLPGGADLMYSMKANPHEDVLRSVKRLGCSPEVSSTGELLTAVKTGYRPSACFYTGPGKTDSELDTALAIGVTTFSVESVGEISRLQDRAAAAGVLARIVLRINPARDRSAGSLHMTGSASQFGIDVDQVGGAVQRAKTCTSLQLHGLHFFSVTNARSEETLAGEMASHIACASTLTRDTGVPVSLLDLGGGFAAPYAQPGDRPTYPALRDRLERSLDAHFPRWRDGLPTVSFESGRYVVGSCGQLVATVTDVKRSQGRAFVVLDAGLNVIGGISGTGRLLPTAIKPLVPSDRPLETVDVVGPLCTPIDVMGRALELPELRPGDRVIIPNVGAYGATASLLAFLGRPAPIEVVVKGGEVVSVTRLEVSRVPLSTREI